MKYRSRKPKPPTGIEMTMTCSLSAGCSLDEARRSILAFLEIWNEAAKTTGAVWFKMRLDNLPPEFEAPLQVALDEHDRRPRLTIVVNNS